MGGCCVRKWYFTGCLSNLRSTLWARQERDPPPSGYGADFNLGEGSWIVDSEGCTELGKYPLYIEAE